MRLSFLIALSIGLAWPGMASAARETRRLAPSSNWVVDYAEDSCRLGRKFGEGGREVTLILDQFSPGEWFKVTFLGKSIRPRSEMRQIAAVLRWGPNEQEAEITGLLATTGDLPTFLVDSTHRLAPITEAERKESQDARRRGIAYELEPIGEARERAATWLELRKVLSFDLVLETRRMDQPLAALRNCTWNLVKSWGLDVEQQKGRTRHAVAKSSPQTWFRAADYPGKMLRGGYEGIVHFRLIVDENGKATSCHIQNSTRPKEFDDLVCRSAMKHAQFEPALDAQGKPVRSFWRQTVHFRLEN